MSLLEDQLHDIIMQTKIDLAVVDAVEQIMALFEDKSGIGSGVGMNFPGGSNGV